ncbi:MAG: helix-turn-helix domain-containing protein [Thermodesulfobacteriota bacterium]
MNLEKFCIVKRRKQGLCNSSASLIPNREENPSTWANPPHPSQEDFSKEESVLSLDLTPTQSRVIRSGGILPLLNTAAPKTFNVDLQQKDDGAVIFNFHLQNFMMLNPQQVCQMMQVSRSFLNRMIIEKRIKSYKIGRLRRFFLNDILENLNGNPVKKTIGLLMK